METKPCMCKTCAKQITCTECEFCHSVSEGCLPVIGCPDYVPIEVPDVN